MTQRHKLTATAIRNKRKRGMFNDGSGLYLRVTDSGSRSWIFRWRDRDTGKLRDMGLGPVDCASQRTIGASLTAARQAAAEAREHVQAERDPKAERDRERLARRAKTASSVTFAECAARYIKMHAAGWKSPKHAAQWRTTLPDIAGPVIGHLPPSEIETAHILRILEPIWTDKTETGRNRESY